MINNINGQQVSLALRFLPSSDGDDTFTVAENELGQGVFDGAGGTDTLQLVGGGTFDMRKPLVFRSIERIVGSEHSDTIIITAEQSSDLLAVDGGANPLQAWDVLRLEGNAFDLRGKALTNLDRIEIQTDGSVLTTDSGNIALLTSGYVSQNDHLILVGDAFTAAQIRMLHQRGIDMITDANGTYMDAAPLLVGIGGERTPIAVGETVFLDMGQDATITDDGRIGALNVLVTKDFHDGDWLGIDTSGSVSLSAGVEVGSAVTVDGMEVGMIWGAGGPKIEIAFNQNATPASVQETLRALTYTASSAAPLSSKHREISLEISDDGGRWAKSIVGIDQFVNEAPTAIRLGQTAVIEAAPNGTLIGVLSATDPNPNETFSFALVDNAGGRFALDGNRLVVADSTKLDYELEDSHRVTIRVTDAGKLSYEQTITILVQDVKDTPTSSPGDGEVIVAEPGRGPLIGGRGNDTLIGSSGADRLSGGRGDDLIYGKRGNDTLNGGVGRDKFVFDTKPDKKNVDRITDFSVKDDAMCLDNAIFNKLGKAGSLKKPTTLQKKMFWKGPGAHDADDRIIYNTKNGVLYYDVDGTGSISAVKIAVLPKNLKAMSSQDFFVI